MTPPETRTLVLGTLILPEFKIKYTWFENCVTEKMSHKQKMYTNLSKKKKII